VETSRLGLGATEAEKDTGAGQQRAHIFWIWESFWVSDKSRIIAVIFNLTLAFHWIGSVPFVEYFCLPEKGPNYESAQAFSQVTLSIEASRWLGHDTPESTGGICLTRDGLDHDLAPIT
jgi:hypothetical protein